PSDKGELYAGTNKGLARWDGTQFTQTGLPKALRNARILALARDRDGNLWIGTAQGLFRSNAQGLSAPDATGPEKDGSARFEDREGNMWVGRDEELQRIGESTFVVYQMENGRGEQDGGPIHADADGRVWAALGNRGLYQLGKSGQKKTAIANLGTDEVYSI